MEDADDLVRKGLKLKLVSYLLYLRKRRRQHTHADIIQVGA
jgi:hypothetical protein